MINFKSIIEFINILNKPHQQPIDYVGKALQVKYVEDNSKHFNKDKKMNVESFSTPATTYCGGPLYYLSNTALQCFTPLRI